MQFGLTSTSPYSNASALNRKRDITITSKIIDEDGKPIVFNVPSDNLSVRCGPYAPPDKRRYPIIPFTLTKNARTVQTSKIRGEIVVYAGKKVIGKIPYYLANRVNIDPYNQNQESPEVKMKLAMEKGKVGPEAGRHFDGFARKDEVWVCNTVGSTDAFIDLFTRWYGTTLNATEYRRGHTLIQGPGFEKIMRDYLPEEETQNIKNFYNAVYQEGGIESMSPEAVKQMIDLNVDFPMDMALQWFGHWCVEYPSNVKPRVNRHSSSDASYILRQMKRTPLPGPMIWAVDYNDFKPVYDAYKAYMGTLEIDQQINLARSWASGWADLPVRLSNIELTMFNWPFYCYICEGGDPFALVDRGMKEYNIVMQRREESRARRGMMTTLMTMPLMAVPGAGMYLFLTTSLMQQYSNFRRQQEAIEEEIEKEEEKKKQYEDIKTQEPSGGNGGPQDDNNKKTKTLLAIGGAALAAVAGFILLD